MSDFLTHEELDISCEEKCALVRVMEGLESGLYVHSKDDSEGTPEGKRAFNLGVSCDDSYVCGTVGCIGGWVGFELKKSTRDSHGYVFANEHSSLGPLYFPTVLETWEYEKITPAQAACAIRNFLSTGDPGWGEILL